MVNQTQNGQATIEASNRTQHANSAVAGAAGLDPARSAMPVVERAVTVEMPMACVMPSSYIPRQGLIRVSWCGRMHWACDLRCAI